ncbi:MAG: alginate export family protein [Lentimicrobium sp.]|nr:alginate export family protein [Lentimicrobium sp.]HPG33432.1 alginate export family protein [Lentimicrobium sp.]
MKHFSVNLISIVLFTVLFVQHGNAQFSIDAQLRNRFELRDGYQKLAAAGSSPTALISQRTRLSFSFENNYLKIKLTPQDVRLWGDQTTLNSTGVGDNPSLDLLEAYAELKIGNAGWISAGRQQLVYDSRRLLGDRNWNQNGIAYDALVMKLNLSHWNLHTGIVWNTMAESLSENLYPSSRIKNLNFFWLNKKINDRLNLSLLHISSGITKTDTTSSLHFRHTTGFYAEYKTKQLNVWANAYYQYGRSQKGNHVSAYLIDADASYKTGEFTTGIGLGYLSGNNQTITTDKTDKLFDPLYGNRHRFFGFIDYFRTFTTHTKQGGLADYYLWLDYKFSKKTSIRNTLHSFALAQTNPATPNDKGLGVENDLILKYKFNEWGDLESGYCFFLPTQTLKTIQNVPDNKFSQFFYLQLTITPNIFKQNKPN